MTAIANEIDSFHKSLKLDQWVRVESDGRMYRVHPDRQVTSGFQKVRIGDLHKGDRVWIVNDELGMAGIVV